MPQDAENVIISYNRVTETIPMTLIILNRDILAVRAVTIVFVAQPTAQR